MRRFLLTTSDLPPRRGGVARYHAAVLRALGGDGAVYAVPPDHHWTRLFLQLPRARLRAHADALLVGEVLPIGTIAWILRMMTGTRYAVMCHGLDLRNALRVPRKRWLTQRVLRRADHIIVNSRFTASLVERLGVGSQRVRIVPPPLGVTPNLERSASIASVRAQDGLQHARIILSVGRLVPRKGFDTLIRAVALLRREFPRAMLALAGDGPDRARLEAIARSERIAVRFLGNLDDANIAAWYTDCDVFALLPRELSDGDVEGFGIVYLEAGAFGKPVVGTRSGGAPEAVIDGINGLLVPQDDPIAASAALATLLRDRDLAQRLGAQGERRAREEFSDEQFAARLRAALI
ncbi:glycosyltransferase [Candidatus Uhrbacteria bacterium]|nr:glycosyltransferase [Candidatus Uhrbacteria bacterium]